MTNSSFCESDARLVADDMPVNDPAREGTTIIATVICSSGPSATCALTVFSKICK
jgi:hypothetical protein